MYLSINAALILCFTIKFIIPIFYNNKGPTEQKQRTRYSYYEF